MTLYYVKQFGLWYGGMTGKNKDEFVFTNTQRDAIALDTRGAAETKCDELGNDSCEIVERII